MEKWKRRSVDLMTSLIFGGRESISVVPYYPQKLAVGGSERPYFSRTVPERKGISSRRLYNMLCELEAERRANIHGISVLIDGEIICECASPGYNMGEWHAAHSMSKTVCGMVIGCLYDEGRIELDMKLAGLFPEMKYRDRRFAHITVEHLLTMTSGVEFGEPGIVTEKNWTEAFFSSVLRFSPGTRFDYNSMNTYMLARLAERISGESFGKLAEHYIFAPAGISNYMWELGPEGTEKAGWGLYMSPQSWLKLGHMILSGGVMDNKRILSEEWIGLMSSAKAITPSDNGSFNYSYQAWVGRDSDELLFSGMLGQNLWICPKNRIVVLMTAGNNELFAASPALEIVRKYLGMSFSDKLNFYDSRLLLQKQKSFFDSRRWARPTKRRRSLLSLFKARYGDRVDPAWERILGSYALCKNDVGLLPLVLRIMQNNLDHRLQTISFARERDRLIMIYRESGESFYIPIGLYDYEESRLKVGDELFVVRAIGEVVSCAEGEEYRIEIIFSETASVRRISVKRIGKGRLSLCFSETPNERLLRDYLANLSKKNRANSFAMDVIEQKFGRGVIDDMMKKTFSPTLIAVSTSQKGYERLIEEENRRIEAEQGKASFIRAVVNRFFRETE